MAIAVFNKPLLHIVKAYQMISNVEQKEFSQAHIFFNLKKAFENVLTSLLT